MVVNFGQIYHNFVVGQEVPSLPNSASVIAESVDVGVVVLLACAERPTTVTDNPILNLHTSVIVVPTAVTNIEGAEAIGVIPMVASVVSSHTMKGHLHSCIIAIPTMAIASVIIALVESSHHSS